MAKAITLPKDKSSFPDHLDYFYLREQGLEHIQKLGSELWTDFNLHDPGVTILEVLCYAITDIGYRANLDIKDLLARSVEDKQSSAKDLLGHYYDNNFFTAANILGCNPLTINDFRKLLIDISGVKNAWIERADQQETRIGIDTERKALFYLEGSLPEQNNQDDDNGGSDSNTSNELKLNGLYDICIEIEPQVYLDACGRTVISREGIIKQAFEVFHMHRNLCEDVRDIVINGEEEIAICADIELSTEADPEEVMLQISLEIEEFLSPTLRFYTLQEMMEKGKTVEEIFEGRPMTNPDDQFENEYCKTYCDKAFIPGHGFIDLEDLKRLEPQARIYTSDIHESIMDIEGVLALHNLVLVNYVNELPQTKGERWCLPLTKGYRPHLSVKLSKINFRKGPLYFSYDQQEVIQRFSEEKYARSKACLEPYQLDLPIPEGTYRDLQSYTSIQREFPMTYGVGKEGITDPPTPLRKALAHQLKGYLLFFDQILANYLSQLAHIRDLFGIRTENDYSTNGGNRTYYTQVLKDDPHIAELIKNYNTCHTECLQDRWPEDYPSYLACITENQEDYQKRKNRFLDHLLARFSESFSDYVTLIYKIQKENRNEQHIIDSKAAFLKNYPDISRNRGKGFNVLEKPVWNSDNVAGLKKRLTGLLGIESPDRRSLSNGEVIETPEGWRYVIEDHSTQPVLKSTEVFHVQSDAQSVFDLVEPYLGDQDRYSILCYQIPELNGYSFTIEDDSGQVLVRSTQHFTSIDDLKSTVDEIVNLFRRINQGEQVVYNYPQEPEYYNYQVLDGDDKPILESEKNFFTQEDAELSQTVLELLAVGKENYCRQNSVIKDNVQYGFALLNEPNKEHPPEVLAESIERYDSLNACKEALYSFICNVNLKGIGCEVNQEKDCFEYWIYDWQHQKVILKSYYGFSSRENTLAGETIEDPENDDPPEVLSKIGYHEFLRLAIVRTNYENIDLEDSYGFRLIHSSNGNDTVAVHPYYYETKQERTDRMWAIIYYLDQELPTPPVLGGEPGTFAIQIRDQEGEIILTSPAEESDLNFKTEKHARRVYQKIQRRASDTSRQYYVLIDDLEGEEPFGFQVRDRDNSILAQHPHQYSTAEERDLAIKILMYGIRNQLVTSRHMQEEEGYRFELLDMDHELMLQSTAFYQDQEASEAGWSELLSQACARSNYRLVKTEDDSSSFTFELLNESGEVLAVHPKAYASKKERDMALQSVINYTCFTEFQVDISGSAGTYTYELVGKENQVLLESATSYADESTARSAFWEMVSWAREYANYNTGLENFRFEVVDDQQMPLARPPAGYEFVSENEREAAIAMIMAYLRKDTIQYDIENVGGSFYAEITDNQQQLLLRGTNLSPSREKADEELARLTGKGDLQSSTGYITNPDNYEVDENERRHCRFGFIVRDDENNIVARHPRMYRTWDEINGARLNVLSWVSDWRKLKENIITTHKWYEFRYWDSTISLLVDFQFIQEHGIASFQQLVSVEANYMFEQENNLYKVVLRDDRNRIVARSYKFYQTKKEAKSDLENVLLFVKLNALPYAFSADYKQFHLADGDGNILLVSTQEYKNNKSATEGLINACGLGGSRANYLLLPVEDSDPATDGANEREEANGENRPSEPASSTAPQEPVPTVFGFELKDGDTTIARNSITYSSAEERNQALEQLITTIQSDWTPNRIETTVEKFIYELKDFSGKVLLTTRHIQEFDSESQAALPENYDEYFGHALQAGNYRSLLSYHDAGQNDYSCYFSFQVASEDAGDERLLFNHPDEYTSQEERDEVISTILNLLTSRHYNALVNGKCCGFLFRMETGMQDSDSTIRVEGEIRYPEEGEAWKAADIVAGWMLNPQHYVSPEEGEAIWLVKDGWGVTIARIYADAGNADEIRDHIIQQLTNPGPTVNHHIGALEPGFCYQLKKDDILLLKSTQQFTFKVDEASTKEESFQNACELSNEISELAQHEKYIRSTYSVDECLHGFEVVGKEGAVIATHDQLYLSLAEKQDIYSGIAKCLDNEGLHLVEHILLRPRTIGLPPRYHFTIPDNQNKPLLRGTVPVTTADRSWADPVDYLFNHILKNANEVKTVRVDLCGGSPAFAKPHHFHILINEEVVAISERIYKEYNIQTFRDEVKNAFQTVILKVADLSWPEDKAGITSILSSYITNERTAAELEGDQFLPAPGLCSTDEDHFSAEVIDPYSFRLTIVLPYWPKRFNDPEFREFMETTIRRETPAHILPRICWLDTCQMQVFEEAYRDWLDTLDLENDHCNATAARNALIEVLTQLRSTYPVAHLHDCDQKNLEINNVIIDHTRLG